jgi:hypothetical protein
MERTNHTENKELRSTKILNAPAHIIWEVWTNPEHITNWWGPDGTNYPNRSIFKEIIPFKKIVFEHFNPHFITTVLFESKGKETLLDWSLLFDSEEMYNIIVKAHKADEGQKQNLEKLEKYLAEMLNK